MNTNIQVQWFPFIHFSAVSFLFFFMFYLEPTINLLKHLQVSQIHAHVLIMCTKSLIDLSNHIA